VTLSRTTVRQGQTVDGVLIAENRSRDRVDITHPYLRCPIVYGLARGGEFVGGRPIYYCATALEGDSLAPGEVRRWTFTLDTLTNTEERSPLPPGSYDAAAGLDVVEKGVWYAPQLTFIIEG
jgi:hypothetical protein